MGRNKDRRPLQRPGAGDALASGLAVAALALLAGFISLPFLSLLLWTVNENSWRAMASPVALDALFLSIKTTSVSMAIIVTVGTPAAYVLARADFPGKKIVDTLVDVPAVLPPSAAGIALLLAFGGSARGQHLRCWGDRHLHHRGVVIAEVFVAGHFYVRRPPWVRRGAARRGRGGLVDGADGLPPSRRYRAAGVSGPGRRGDDGVGAGAGGVRGDHRLRRQLPRGHPDPSRSPSSPSSRATSTRPWPSPCWSLGFAFAVILTVKYLTAGKGRYEG
jgi:hypothetical protein